MIPENVKYMCAKGEELSRFTGEICKGPITEPSVPSPICPMAEALGRFGKGGSCCERVLCHQEPPAEGE